MSRSTTCRVAVPLLTAALLGSLAACAAPRPASEAIGLPEPDSDQIVFYYGLPHDRQGLRAAAEASATPTSPSYRSFLGIADAATRYGASESVIQTAAATVTAKGLSISVDPTRLFARVYGSAEQWVRATGRPLERAVGSSSYPFDVYGLSASPGFGSDLVDLGATATVYRKDLDGQRPRSATSSPQVAPDAATPGAAQPWPRNTGQPLGTACQAGYLQARAVYTPSQVATAYGTPALVSAAGDPARVRAAVIDLGGGWNEADLSTAADCFGYRPVSVTVSRGDGVGEAIANASDETLLDLQTMAAVLPGARLDLVQATNGAASTLDAISRALSAPKEKPDVISVSYGECALAEDQDPALVRYLDDVLAMAAMSGTSVFVAAGDQGSTVCGTKVEGPTQSFPASSPWVTAVGGTRLFLGAGNAVTDQVTWNDAPYGAKGAGSGGLSRVFARPWYQESVAGVVGSQRGLPDLAALAAVIPGWPVVVDNGQGLRSVGGTSGASPFVAANMALLALKERADGRPALGLVNPWLYAARERSPQAFFDVTQGDNDLDDVGCCSAGAGYDLTTGLGAPRFDRLAGTLPPPASG